MSEDYDIHDSCEEIPEEGYEFPEGHAAPQPSGPPVEVPSAAEPAVGPATESAIEPDEEPGLARQVAELQGQMAGVLDRLATVERDLATIRRVEVSPPPRILDVSMMPTRDEMEGVRGLVDQGIANGNGPVIPVPAAKGSPTPPPVLTEAPMPNTPGPDEAAGSAVRQLLRVAGIPFTQVRVRWEMNERRAAVYLDRDAVMDMVADLPEGGASFAEILEWGEAICHALAATPQGGRVEEMKWFPYSRDDDAWWGAKVLIPHLGL